MNKALPTIFSGGNIMLPQYRPSLFKIECLIKLIHCDTMGIIGVA